MSIRTFSDVNAMVNKGNGVLYLDKELVEKSKELGFNLSKIFENHLKHLITGYSAVSMQNSGNLSENKTNLVGLPVPIPKWVQNLFLERRHTLFLSKFIVSCCGVSRTGLYPRNGLSP